MNPGLSHDLSGASMLAFWCGDGDVIEPSVEVASVGEISDPRPFSLISDMIILDYREITSSPNLTWVYFLKVSIGFYIYMILKHFAISNPFSTIQICGSRFYARSMDIIWRHQRVSFVFWVFSHSLQLKKSLLSDPNAS